MARPRKPARLYLRPDTGEWIIRDGSRTKRTGYFRSQREQAEQALQTYLASREPERRTGPAHPHEVTVGQVLAAYIEHKGDTVRAPDALIYSARALGPFWADRTCDAVKGATCRTYERSRAVTASTVRRELGVLQAALNHAHAEGVLVHPIKVVLPPAGEPRDRWLSRTEVARLLRAAPPHLRRFILISIYTGRRMSAVLGLTWTRVDQEQGIIRFKDDGQIETKKRRGRLIMPRQLRAHFARWRRTARLGETHVVSFRGKSVATVRKAVKNAASAAGLGTEVTPHSLKHTSVTWAVMTGISVEAAAEYFDTSAETIRKHYWHHSPHHQAEARGAFERRVSVHQSVRNQT